MPFGVPITISLSDINATDKTCSEEFFGTYNLSQEVPVLEITNNPFMLAAYILLDESILSE